MLVVLAVAVLFYGVLPMVGAWRVRRSWAQFRESATQALGSPEVDFAVLQPGSPLPSHPLRLTGTLEAFEGEDRLWIGNERVSLAVSLRGVPVYFVDEEPEPFALGVEPPRKADAGSLGALPEGTQFLVCGMLVRDAQGQAHFASTPQNKLLVLAFEGSSKTVLNRAVFAGRSVIDHWNSWTPLAVGIGFLLLLVMAYADLRPGGDRPVALVALALALLPSTFFLPPGIFFFYGFGRVWSQARDRRARLDLTRVITGQAAIDQQSGVRRAFLFELLAHGFLAAAVLTNGAILVSLLRLWIPSP